MSACDRNWLNLWKVDKVKENSEYLYKKRLYNRKHIYKMNGSNLIKLTYFGIGLLHIAVCFFLRNNSIYTDTRIFSHFLPFVFSVRYNIRILDSSTNYAVDWETGETEKNRKSRCWCLRSTHKSTWKKQHITLILDFESFICVNFR